MVVTHIALVTPYRPSSPPLLPLNNRMSAIKLELLHAFGSTCSQRYKNCIAICD
jgi:hypothetical protein